MAAEPQAKVFPAGVEGEHPHGPPTVVVTHGGCRIMLRFAPGDFFGEGPIQELRVLPETEGPLKLGALLRFAPKAETYLAYARSAMRLLALEGTPESNWENFRRAGEALREISGPGRGLSREFYRMIAENYEALVDEGEPHPIKALSKIHHVSIGASSRWVSEAKRRRLIPKKVTTRAS
jgi:hypothetical protein